MDFLFVYLQHHRLPTKIRFENQAGESRAHLFDATGEIFNIGKESVDFNLHWNKEYNRTARILLLEPKYTEDRSQIPQIYRTLFDQKQNNWKFVV